MTSKLLPSAQNDYHIVALIFPLPPSKQNAVGVSKASVICSLLQNNVLRSGNAGTKANVAV